MEKKLLSICIPTYNRAAYLDRSISSIVSQKEFTSENVEIIISDNCSSDNTLGITRKWQAKYKNIYYFRNEENVRDRNFPIVIGKAHGVFRKLSNDTLLYKKKTIKYMIDVIRNNIINKPILLFKNKNLSFTNQYTTNEFDSIVKKMSFLLTSSALFGIWEEDFYHLDDIYDGCKQHLWQTKTALKMLNNKREAIIIKKKLFYVQDPVNKDLSYDLYKIFCDNYFEIMSSYLNSGTLSNKTFEYIKRDLLFNYLTVAINYRYFINKTNKTKLFLKESEDVLFTYYYDRKYLTLFRIRMGLVFTREILKKYCKYLLGINRRIC